MVSYTDSQKGDGMLNNQVTLENLEEKDKEQFILDNQEAFQVAALGVLVSPLEEEPVISRQDIEESLANGIAYQICLDGERVGGAVVSINGDKGDLELLFISPNMQGKGIGYTAWALLEKAYPKVKIWQTMTPYFDKRNIHFYVNRCGFQIVEFFHPHHPDRHRSDDGKGLDQMFRFEKRKV